MLGQWPGYDVFITKFQIGLNGRRSREFLKKRDGLRSRCGFVERFENRDRGIKIERIRESMKIEKVRNFYIKKNGGLWFFKIGSLIGGSVYFKNDILANLDRKMIMFMIGLTTGSAILSLL